MACSRQHPWHCGRSPTKYTLVVARIGYQTIQKEPTIDSGRTVKQYVGPSDRASSSPYQVADS